MDKKRQNSVKIDWKYEKIAGIHIHTLTLFWQKFRESNIFPLYYMHYAPEFAVFNLTNFSLNQSKIELHGMVV